MSRRHHGVAVVTGASRGIGLASAVALADRGMRVALLAPASSHLELAADAIRDRGRDALPIPCDVTSEASLAAAAAHVLAAWGPARVVVPNAGIVRRGKVHELSTEDFDATMAVNLRGVFLTARAFLPAMLAERAGRIVAVASISGTLGTAGASAYNASKWGVLGFVKSLAEELRGTGLQAIAINPGSVDTDMLRGSPYAPQMQPQDVARVVAFAALDAPDAMNGAALDIFGPLPHPPVPPRRRRPAVRRPVRGSKESSWDRSAPLRRRRPRLLPPAACARRSRSSRCFRFPTRCCSRARSCRCTCSSRATAP